METLYCFIDEGGNVDFSPNGSRYFSLTCVSQSRPFQLSSELDVLKFNLIERGLNINAFHCSNDNRYVRENVFNIITKNLQYLRANSLIFDKRKVPKDFIGQKEFYTIVFSALMKHVCDNLKRYTFDKLIFITDTLPIQRKRSVIEKAIKQTLRRIFPKDLQFSIMHHPSKSSYGLQVADYCNWAIFRKWEKCDEFYYMKIKDCIETELTPPTTETGELLELLSLGRDLCDIIT